MKIIRRNNLDSLQQFVFMQRNILEMRSVSSLWCKNA